MINDVKEWHLLLLAFVFGCLLAKFFVRDGFYVGGQESGDDAGDDVTLTENDIKLSLLEMKKAQERTDSTIKEGENQLRLRKVIVRLSLKESKSWLISFIWFKFR